MQIVYFPSSRDEFLFRIGHYVPENYRQVKEENNNPFNHASEYEKKRKLKTSERLWCSFRSEHLEFSELFGGDLDLMMMYSEEKQPVTKQMSADLWNKVADEGWKIKQSQKLSLT